MRSMVITAWQFKCYESEIATALSFSMDPLSEIIKQDRKKREKLSKCLRKKLKDFDNNWGFDSTHNKITIL